MTFCENPLSRSLSGPRLTESITIRTMLLLVPAFYFAFGAAIQLPIKTARAAVSAFLIASFANFFGLCGSKGRRTKNGYAEQECYLSQNRLLSCQRMLKRMGTVKSNVSPGMFAGGGGNGCARRTVSIVS